MHGVSALSPRPLIFGRLGPKKPFPPTPTVRIEEIDPRATAAPTPAFIFSFPAWGSHKQPAFRSFFVDRVIRSSLQVRVDNDDHLNELNP